MADKKASTSKDALLEFFNDIAVSSPYLKVCNIADLILGQMYFMHTLEEIKTRYGDRLLVTLYLNDVPFAKVWLGEKYKAISKKFNIAEYNNRKENDKYYLIYSGLSVDQGFELSFRKVIEN